MDIKSFITNKLILDQEKIYQIFLDHISNNKGIIITYFNQNSFNIFYSNHTYQNALKHSIVYQEGIGMFLAYKILGIKSVARINSSDFNNWILNLIISKKERVIFIGGSFDYAELKERCKQKDLILEFYHHGFFDGFQKSGLIEKLKNTKARFVLIGMGSPKQEILAYELFQNFPEKIYICIGNLMNYFLGYQKRAPKILRTLQLEWLYRLFQEPRRLFKRYILGIPLFFLRVIFRFRK